MVITRQTRLVLLFDTTPLMSIMAVGTGYRSGNSPADNTKNSLIGVNGSRWWCLARWLFDSSSLEPQRRSSAWESW